MLRTPLINSLNILAIIKRYSSTKPSYLHSLGSEPLRYITVGTLLEQANAKFGDNKAVVAREQKKSLTYSQILDQADKLAAGFRLLGLEKMDCIGLWAPNVIEWYITSMACARSGLIMASLNPNYQPLEIERSINKINMKAMVCGEKLKNQDFYEYLVTLAPELTKCDPGKLKSLRLPSLQTVITMGESKKTGTYNFEEVLDLATDNEIMNIKKNQNCISPDDLCNLQVTSGTTGRSKIVPNTHFGVVNNAFGIGKRMDLSTKHHTLCMQIPFFHTFGTVCVFLTALNYGSTLVLPTPGYNPDKTLDALKEEQCTVIYGTPTMFVDLVQTQKQRKENISVEIAVTAAALCSPHLLKQMLEVLNVKRVHSIYGLTEVSGAAFESLSVESQDKALTTVGYVSEHLEVKVVDKDNKVVPCGTPGELCIRGYANMRGYLGDEDKTKETISEDGWLKTGDQFVLEEDGYGKIIGRLKEVIIRGGENIFPREIEDLLNTHPDILEAYVIGVPHEKLGEELCACVRIKSGSTFTLENMVSFCKGKMSSFKIPSKLKIFDDLPITASGKVQKFKLKENIFKV